jgi:hypothetical protein
MVHCAFHLCMDLPTSTSRSNDSRFPYLEP